MQRVDHATDDLEKNYKQIKNQISACEKGANRTPGTVQFIAVSKGHSAKKIEILHQLTRHQIFGESYAQELLEKAAELKHLDLEWHFIGQLQSNKIAKLVRVVSCIHSVASEKHAKLIAEQAVLMKRIPFPIYLSVNAAGEASKGGISLAEVDALAAHIEQAHSGTLTLEGIMAIPPDSYTDLDYPTSVPKLYVELSDCAKRVGKGKLSLGMSSDLCLAIKAGSNCVRIGTALFGERL